MNTSAVRHDWSVEEVEALFGLPFSDLMFRAQETHRAHHPANAVQMSTTRTYQDRLDTLAAVRDAGLNVCCGGIVGMGETTRDRASMLATLANLPQHPESVPINQLVRVPGTPLAGQAPVDPFDFVRT